jgi:hypothetical protein
MSTVSPSKPRNAPSSAGSALDRIFGGPGMAENGPGSPSDVAIVFASRSRGILGHVGAGGVVASDARAEILRWIADQANELNFTGQGRIDYVKEQGEKALRMIFGDLEVVDYRSGERPSKA